MSNSFGILLNQFRLVRKKILSDEARQIWLRNKAEPHDPNYKLEEVHIMTPDGINRTQLQLWKLIDGSVVNVSPNLTASVKSGIQELSLPTVYERPAEPGKEEEEEEW